MARQNEYVGADKPHQGLTRESAEVRDMALTLKLQIPQDTRNLTQVICGDPLPGRSALERMQGQNL